MVKKEHLTMTGAEGKDLYTNAPQEPSLEQAEVEREGLLCVLARPLLL